MYYFKLISHFTNYFEDSINFNKLYQKKKKLFSFLESLLAASVAILALSWFISFVSLLILTNNNRIQEMHIIMLQVYYLMSRAED